MFLEQWVNVFYINGNDIREIEKDPYNRHTYINYCNEEAINKYLSSKKINNPNIDITHGRQYSCYIHGNDIHLNFPPITSTNRQKEIGNMGHFPRPKIPCSHVGVSSQSTTNQFETIPTVIQKTTLQSKHNS